MAKKLISSILILSMLLSLFPGCSSENAKSISNPTESDSQKNNISSETSVQTEENNRIDISSETIYDSKTENSTDSSLNQELAEFDWKEELRFTGMSDDSLSSYLEDAVYTQLIQDLDSSDYYIEDVSTKYVSQEYLRTLAYNSKTNVFFGYSLAELDSFFEGTKYVFTLGDNGQTTVEPLQTIKDTTFEQIVENVAVGTGVILVCVTVCYVTGGLGMPAASAIFAVAAERAAICALSGTMISGVTSAFVKGYQTGDLKEALKAGTLGASEGYKWGAITGAVSGGAEETLGLYSATGNGLTMNEVATIQHESQYPLSLIRQFHSMDEYNVFKNAGLKAQMLAGKLTLVRSDIDLYNVVDEFGRNNYTRLSKGLNPIDSTGKTFEWHHIGQNNDATLSLLTSAEHDAGALHGYKIVSEINRNAFNEYKKELNKALLKWLLGGA